MLVLIDGDNYIFNDDLIRDRVDGGIKAAQMLHAHIRQEMLELGQETHGCRIVVRIFASTAGLSRALSNAGILSSEPRALAPFAAAFTRSQGLFEFVDAGDKMENADFKIRGSYHLATRTLPEAESIQKCFICSSRAINVDIYSLPVVTTLAIYHFLLPTMAVKIL